MGKVFEGLKVVDLTTALNGPFCTMFLGDYGADVIKIEPVGGEQSRSWGPIDEKSGVIYLTFFPLYNFPDFNIGIYVFNPPFDAAWLQTAAAIPQAPAVTPPAIAPIGPVKAPIIDATPDITP